MTTRRQGRFRGDPEPKPVKVIPLRYRVLPVERDFDNLDMLQAELNREYNAVPSRMDAEEYHTLQAVIDKRRATITARRASLTGECVEKDYASMPFSEDLPKRIVGRLSPRVCGWVLASGVAVWLMATNGIIF